MGRAMNMNSATLHNLLDLALTSKNLLPRANSLFLNNSIPWPKSSRDKHPWEGWKRRKFNNFPTACAFLKSRSSWWHYLIFLDMTPKLQFKIKERMGEVSLLLISPPPSHLIFSTFFLLLACFIVSIWKGEGGLHFLKSVTLFIRITRTYT